MSNNMTAEFEAIRRRLSLLPNVIQKRVVRGATRAAGVAVKKEIQKNVPVDKSKLKKSISVKSQRRGLIPQGHEQVIIYPKKAYYSWFIEFGTSKMSPQPFMRPAFLNSRVLAVQAFQDYAFRRIQKEIEKLSRQ